MEYYDNIYAYASRTMGKEKHVAMCVAAHRLTLARARTASVVQCK